MRKSVNKKLHAAFDEAIAAVYNPEMNIAPREEVRRVTLERARTTITIAEFDELLDTNGRSVEKTRIGSGMRALRMAVRSVRVKANDVTDAELKMMIRTALGPIRSHLVFVSSLGCFRKIGALSVNEVLSLLDTRDTNIDNVEEARKDVDFLATAQMRCGATNGESLQLVFSLDA